MQSILNEIQRLRMGEPIEIDYQNTNRYRLVLQEGDGSKTAYYFSAPIYNRRSRKIVDLLFQARESAICATGSDVNITLLNNIRMENSTCACTMKLTEKPILVSPKEVMAGKDRIYPTTNGVAIKQEISGLNSINISFEVRQPFLNLRTNNRCFAIMKERFTPFVVFSAIGAFDSTGNMISTAELEYKKLSNNEYQLIISTKSPSARYIMFECNLYENKLFQDTTVESLNPNTNNAFGSTSFIGNTATYGQQWLYSRPDYSKISEIMDKYINKAVLHIPKFNSANVEISAYKVETRFCSFGSNWINKVSGNTMFSRSTFSKGYQNIDLTDLLINKKTRTMLHTEGLILKPSNKDGGFSAISTGDSCFAPQIFEVNYR